MFIYTRIILLEKCSICLLLSDRIQWMESIVIMKKFDFEILTFLYFLRSPEFTDAILRRCMYICVYVYVSEPNSVEMVRSIELKLYTYIYIYIYKGHRRTKH